MDETRIEPETPSSKGIEGDTRDSTGKHILFVRTCDIEGKSTKQNVMKTRKLRSRNTPKYLRCNWTAEH